MNLMRNRVVLVTGASKDVGVSCAELFAQNGAKSIFLVDIDFEKVSTLSLRIAAKNGCECIPVRADALEEREVRTVFEIVKDRAGRLDVLVNCAGFEKEDTAGDYEMDSFDFTVDSGLKGAFMFSREAIKLMKKQKSGVVINVVPKAEGFYGWAADNDSYSSKRAGLVYLTKMLAERAAKLGISVKGIAADIGIGPQELHGQTESINGHGRQEAIKETADTVLFLASDLARHMTGTCIDTGGSLAV